MGTHSSVPMDKRLTNVESIKPRLLRILKIYHRGRDKAVNSGKIARMIGSESTGTHQPIREAAKRLLVEDKEPIISCVDGFFYATTSDEIEEYIQNLMKRLNGLKRNLGALREIKTNFEKENNGVLF